MLVMMMKSWGRKFHFMNKLCNTVEYVFWRRYRAEFFGTTSNLNHVNKKHSMEDSYDRD